MTQKEVEIGKVYAAKVSDIVQPVRIKEKVKKWTGRIERTNWLAVNENTGREIRISSAARLRYEVEMIDGKWRPKKAAAPAAAAKPDTI